QKKIFRDGRQHLPAGRKFWRFSRRRGPARKRTAVFSHKVAIMIRPALEPRLRLFLSVDLVGSTAFKHQAAFDKTVEGKAQQTLGPPWLSPIARFYRDFDRQFRSNWQSFRHNLESTGAFECGPAPELWKTSGDELLYTKELNSPFQAWVTV